MARPLVTRREALAWSMLGHVLVLVGLAALVLAVKAALASALGW